MADNSRIHRPYIVAELPSNLLLKVYKRSPSSSAFELILIVPGRGPELDASRHVDILGYHNNPSRYDYFFSGLRARAKLSWFLRGGAQLCWASCMQVLLRPFRRRRIPGVGPISVPVLPSTTAPESVCIYLFLTVTSSILLDTSTSVSAFFSAASISGAFSGLLAFGIINMDGVGNRPGWAWIFILEGLFTVVFGVFSFFFMPRSPEHARFFNEEEKAYVMEKLREDNSIGNDQSDSFSWIEVGRAFMLPQVWLLAITFFFAGKFFYRATTMRNDMLIVSLGCILYSLA